VSEAVKARTQTAGSKNTDSNCAANGRFETRRAMEHQLASYVHVADFATRTAEHFASTREVTRARIYQQVLQDLPMAVYITDANGRITFFNKAAVEMAGCTPRLGVDRWSIAWRLYRPDGEPLPHDKCPMAIALKQNRAIRGEEAIAERPDGTRVPFIAFPTPLRNASGELIGALNLLLDITDRKQAEQKLAHYDLLTGLPNRAVLSAHLSRTIEAASATASSFAVVLMDLDHLKDINDTFGHAVGDEVLSAVANRLKRGTQGCFLARIGGDGFIMIVPNPVEADLRRQLIVLQSSVSAELVIAGHAHRINFSAGVAIVPQHGSDEIEIVANADAALRQAKKDGPQSLRFFDAQIERRIKHHACIQRDLQSTVERNGLDVHYQPLALSTGKVVGFEALARWLHPKKGNISPADFIPIAERSGLILPLSRWVLWQACRQAASWKRPLNIAVNLSPVQFQHEDLPRLVESVLSETGLAAERLELEITEGVLISDSDRAFVTLTKLRKLGVHIALDDFGTGYSSLSYLRDFPFSKIKIDKSFMDNIGMQESAKAIIHAVIGLGHSMEMTVTAEGVETKAQLEYLINEGCDLVQGYLIGRPAPIESFPKHTGKVVIQTKSAYGSDGRLRRVSLAGLGVDYAF
jgi:diguanylate cyclase (GGDEF)-like protein/PAS domain S-box-containing protein